MKSFEAEGVWFLPDDPEFTIPGKLEFSEIAGFRLSLSGSFQRHWSLEGAEYLSVRGSVADSPYGKFVTLFQCFATNMRFGMPGASSEVITANYGFAGSAFVESWDMTFDGATIFMSSLAGWLEITGIKMNPDLSATGFSWDQPDQVECTVDGAKIRTAFEARMTGHPHGHMMKIEETPALRIEEFGHDTAAGIHSRFLGPLLYLMSFASDGKAKLDRYKLNKSREGEVGSDSFDRLYVPAVKPDETASRPMRSIDMLFSLKDVRERYEAFMQDWFAFTAAHPDFCKIWFSYCYEKHGFLETRYLFLMQAVECLVREEKVEAELVQEFGQMRDQFLKDKVLKDHPHSVRAFPSAMQLAMPTLFARFFNRHWALIADVVGTTEEVFVDALFDTLEFVNERGKRSEAVPASQNLYWLLARLKSVTKICLLRILKFDEETIIQIVKRNAEMQFVKSKTGPWSDEIENN